jgi:hypothetical protein
MTSSDSPLVTVDDVIIVVSISILYLNYDYIVTIDSSTLYFVLNYWRRPDHIAHHDNDHYRGHYGQTNKV